MILISSNAEFRLEAAASQFFEKNSHLTNLSGIHKVNFKLLMNEHSLGCSLSSHDDFFHSKLEAYYMHLFYLRIGVVGYRRWFFEHWH